MAKMFNKLIKKLISALGLTEYSSEMTTVKNQKFEN